MLRGIHKASGSWLGKGIMATVMGLIAVSFAIWGIGDIFRGFGRSSLATIGDTEIGIEQFRAYYTDKLNQLGRRMGRPITPDQARALGLDRQLVGQLVAETALDEKAKELRLGVADSEIIRRITTDPTFQGVNGQFDRTKFEQIIRQAGFTESRFVQEQRQVTIRRQIAFSITGDVKPPTAVLAAIDRYQNEKRSADIITLGPAQAGEIAKPDEEALRKYFDERKATFRAPEFRKVVLLPLTPATQANLAAVSDADAKSYYEQRKSEFGTPERRALRQIVFPNAEDASAASERITKGLTFEDLAKERGLKDTDIDLGTVPKTNVIDPAVGEAAFALKEGEVSAPVTGRFGTVLVQATKIEPATQRPYEEVATQIKQTLAETKAKADIGTLRDKIEDERAGGATLAETAKKLNLTARTIEAVDRSGRNPAGTPVPDILQYREVISPVFSTDVGIETDPQQLPGGGFLWYDVVSVTPSRERSLDEVKNQLETRWREDEIAARLKTKADELLEKIKAGSTLEQLASENGLKVEKADNVQRNRPAGFVSARAVDAIFRSGKGAAGSADGDVPTTKLVFVVTDVVEPKLDAASPDASKLAETLKNSYSENMVNEYVAKLESELGVKINQAALQQVVGGSTN